MVQEPAKKNSTVFLFYGVESWSGFMEWSEVKFWSGKHSYYTCKPWISDIYPSSKHAKYMK